jgi:hypothetical protein
MRQAPSCCNKFTYENQMADKPIDTAKLTFRSERSSARNDRSGVARDATDSYIAKRVAMLRNAVAAKLRNKDYILSVKSPSITDDAPTQFADLGRGMKSQQYVDAFHRQNFLKNGEE